MVELSDFQLSRRSLLLGSAATIALGAKLGAATAETSSALTASPAAEMVPSTAKVSFTVNDAARDLGASELRLVRDIYAPLLARSLLASFLQSFVRSVSNISVVVFLVAPGNVMVTFVILQMIGGTDWSGAAALTTFLLILTFLCIGLASLIAGRTSPQLRGFQP